MQLQRCEHVWEKYRLTTWYPLGWVIAVYIGWSNGRPGVYLNFYQRTQEHVGCIVRFFFHCHNSGRSTNTKIIVKEGNLIVGKDGGECKRSQCKIVHSNYLNKRRLQLRMARKVVSRFVDWTCERFMRHLGELSNGKHDEGFSMPWCVTCPVILRQITSQLWCQTFFDVTFDVNGRNELELASTEECLQTDENNTRFRRAWIRRIKV